MTNWSNDELSKVERAEELQIASLRRNDSLRKFTIIWVVRVGDELYVRSVNGRGSDWFKGVQNQHKGRIRAGGVEKDVSFEEIPADNAINTQIDAAYSDKYRRYAKSIIDSITSSKARSATIRLVPTS